MRAAGRIILMIAASAATSPVPPAWAQMLPEAEYAPIANPSPGRVIEVPSPETPAPRPQVDAARDDTQSYVVAPVPGPATRANNGQLPERERSALGPSGPVRKPLGTPGSAAAPTESWLSHWLVRTVTALVALAALLFGTRWLMSRLAPGVGLAAQLGVGGRAPQGVLEVLGRYPVSRGHSLVILKLDRRVLLVGQSPSGFSTLSELTDPEDVASILIKTADDHGRSMNRKFSELLRGAERDTKLIEGETADVAPMSPRSAMRLARREGAAA